MIRRGFTLIELMVVIGIIAIMMALLMPTLARVRQHALTVKCQANLREIGHALMLYANANKGSLPGWTGYHAYPDGSDPEDEPGLGWMEKVAPYCQTPDKPLWACPGFPDEWKMNYFLGSRWVAKSHRDCLKLTDIRSSSQFVLSGDCTQELLYPPPMGTSPRNFQDCDKDDATMPSIVFFGEAGGRNMHPAGNNVLFADNHVASFRKFDPSAMTYSAHEMQDWKDVTGD